jgi:uncharacterized protein YqgC (DUF456 family)
MHYVYYLLLLILLVAGLFINILGLPGLWLMLAAFGGYALLTGWNHWVGWPSLVTLLVLALVAEAVEFFAGAAGSSAAGGRKRGAIGAVIGAFIGAIVFSIIPIPVVAQIIGACIGAFVGAAVMEFTDKDLMHSLRVGVGAAKGRFWGIVGKLGIGIVMLIIAAAAALPFHFKTTRTIMSGPNTPPILINGNPAATAPATTIPSTLPTTEPASAPAP